MPVQNSDCHMDTRSTQTLQLDRSSLPCTVLEQMMKQGSRNQECKEAQEMLREGRILLADRVLGPCFRLYRNFQLDTKVVVKPLLGSKSLRDKLKTHCRQDRICWQCSWGRPYARTHHLLFREGTVLGSKVLILDSRIQKGRSPCM